jgi:hypothetical protein
VFFLLMLYWLIDIGTLNRFFQWSQLIDILSFVIVAITIVVRILRSCIFLWFALIPRSSALGRRRARGSATCCDYLPGIFRQQDGAR